MKKPSYLKDAIAKLDGYYTARGEKLKNVKLSQEQVDEWNGVAKKAAPAPAPVVEEVVVEEEAPVVEEAPKPKRSYKKKKSSMMDKVKSAITK